ncbi:lactose operon repressor [Abditibacteriota bacterium]|nr:lactose operon repressor [Abditibacteriota bacterium]
MRATIRQVAERAQVSRMTVSRVLQGRRHQVSEETYERVFAVMQEMNYIPVRPVMQNRQIQTNTIGLVPYHRNPSRNLIDSLTFEGLCDSAGQNGHDLFIMLRAEAEWMANREELRFLDRRSDGFIFISPGAHEWQTALETLVQHKIPAVVCYRRDVPEGVAWVDPDNKRIVDLALDCLMHQGHRDIAYLSGPKTTASANGLLANISGPRVNYDDESRIRRFSERLSGAIGSKEPFILCPTDPDWKLAPSEVHVLLDSGVTGVMCANDHMALQLWDHLEAMGLRVPDDLSLVSVDNQISAAHRGLSSIGFGYAEVGREAVSAWLELRAGANASACCKVVPVHLVERASVTQPKTR